VRFQKLWLEGYGRFAGKEVAFDGPLQLVLGPNEQGKSTVRCFIGDMLYGQKRSTTQRLYDESNELRRPWQSPDTYGGRLLYELDDGSAFELYRVFDKKQEAVQVFDHQRGVDVTTTFTALKNRELTFAEDHLGLSKAVFLNTATIGHLGLNDLGDDAALEQIRGRILALTDSAEENGSAEAALRRLKERQSAIGRPTANSKRPLALVRGQLKTLKSEHDEAVTMLAEVRAHETRRVELLEELASLRGQRNALDEELAQNEKIMRAQRLKEAETLAASVAENTKECFGLGAARDFPLDKLPEFQRVETRVVAARAQAQRTRDDLKQAQVQHEKERVKLGPQADEDTGDVPLEWEDRIQKTENEAKRLHDRADEIRSALATAEDRVEKASARLEELPEFSKIAADPIEWLNQLSNTFSLHRRSRDSEREKREKLAKELETYKGRVEEPEEVFGRLGDVVGEARNYEVDARVALKEAGELRSSIERLSAAADDYEASIPASMWMALLMSVLAVGIYFVLSHYEVAAILVPEVLVLLGAGYFVLNMFLARAAGKQARRQMAEAKERLAAVEAGQEMREESMTAILDDAHVDSPRELEASYDRFREDSSQFQKLQEAYAAQTTKTQEEEAHVASLFATIQESFAQAGEEIESENDVEQATNRAISRYQAYRDAKRRLAEGRDRKSQILKDLEGAEAELAVASKEDVERSLELRQILRACGFRDEQKHTSALAALRAYRIRHAQVKSNRVRIEVIEENLTSLQRQLEIEEQDERQLEEELNRQLAVFGAASAEECNEAADEARLYEERWAERTRAHDQLERLLDGEELEDLRDVVEKDGVSADGPARSDEEVKAEHRETVDRIEALTKEEHGLHIAVTERLAGGRSINDIEEEQAACEARNNSLVFEMEAATYAATAIESVAQNKHARVAPKLAALASSYLSDVTGGTYSELTLSRDLRISVRIPQTEQMNTDPEQQLSKGTVDQIYLALRLALVQCLGENNESIPMLLDDPFANYDDARLQRAMELLARISEGSQILVFTCREDVAEAARRVGAPILEL
jgi:uncharacterized protein YhaN